MKDVLQHNDNYPTQLQVPAITAQQEEDIMKLAAVGLSPTEIAAAIELEPTDAVLFAMLADVPGSPVARMLMQGRAIGRATPQMKLQEAANAGNIDAVKTLQKIQKENRFQELINNMDNDEFTV